MAQHDDLDMNIPRTRRSGRLSSGQGPESGRKRVVDVDENGVYRPLSIMISERLHRKLGLAVVASGKTKMQFVVECIEPVIDDVLADAGIVDR